MKEETQSEIEHPNAHLQSLTQSSYVDLDKGILKNPVLHRWHVCTPAQPYNIGHVCERLVKPGGRYKK